MNVEQLANLVRRAAVILDENNVENLLAESTELLRQISNQPGNADFASQLEANLQKMEIIASKPKNNLFSPREIDLLERMGIANSNLNALYDTFYRLVHGSDVFASSNAEKMAELLKDVQRIKGIDASLLQLIDNLHLVEVLGEFQPEHDLGAELSFFVPRENAEDSLNSLRKELRDFELLVSSAGELVGKRDYRVQYLSASDFGFILACYPEVVILIVSALDELTSRVGQIKTGMEMLKWAFLKSETRQQVSSEIEELQGDQFLAVAEQVTREMLSDATAPNPETISRFSRALTITASKTQSGYVLDARLTMELEAAPQDEAGRDAPSRLAAGRREISNEDIIARLTRIEDRLEEQQFLPPPETFESPINGDELDSPSGED